MPVIWGLDLRDMQWSNFKSSYMFGNRDYHLRRTKFIIYQCAMIFLVISESLGTAVLSDYLDQQSLLQKTFPGINVYNNDYIGIASFNIFVGVFAAIVFGAGFFFDLFFPDRYEPKWVQWMWMGGAIFASVAGLGDVLAYTVILALHGERISEYDLNDPTLAETLQREHNKTPILYRDSGRAVASVVFLWIGWICAVASTVVMCMFYRYYQAHGTAKSAHVRNLGDGKLDQRDPIPSTEKSTAPTYQPEVGSGEAFDSRPQHHTDSNNHQQPQS